MSKLSIGLVSYIVVSGVGLRPCGLSLTYARSIVDR